MSAPPAIPMLWEGDGFKPAGSHWARLCDKHFVVGQIYPLEVREERSAISHRHFFAAVNEAWQNLPEPLAERFASPDHLRRWALIKSGFRDERSISCSSKAEALRLATFVRPLDDFAVVVARGPLVVVWTAKSQSARAMPKGEFQRSKDAVLDVLAELVGTSREALSQAGKAA